MTTTSTRLLENYIAGRWTPATDATGELDVIRPATGEVLARVPLSGAADLDAAVQAARAALPEWRAISTIARARKLFELRERLVGRTEDLARSVTTEMGKTIADARAEVARMIEMVEAACAIPTTMQGRILEDVSRNIDAETIRQPVGRVRRDRPVQLPGDGAVLVFAVRDRVRQHVRAQAVRAGSAHPADRVRGARRARAAGRASSTWSTAAARSSRGSSITRASTRSRSSARRRSRGSSTSARPRPASACRRSAAPRTTWS